MQTLYITIIHRIYVYAIPFLYLVSNPLQSSDQANPQPDEVYTVDHEIAASLPDWQADSTKFTAGIAVVDQNELNSIYTCQF